jgi:hypothetical protein
MTSRFIFSSTDLQAVSGISQTAVSVREWVWVGVVSALLLILSSLPYLAGYRSQTTQQVFGGAVFDRQDYTVHLATMQIGARGEWKYRMRLTSEPQQGAYVKLFYVFLGHVSRWLGLSLPATYQAGRLFFGLLACLGVFALSARLFPQPSARRLAFVLCTAGAGLGWLQMATGWLPQPDISPIDFWLIDAYIFFGLLTLPHFAAVTAFLCGMLVCFLSFLRKPEIWKWLAIIALGLLLEMIQPYAPLLADLGMVGALLGQALNQRHLNLRTWTALVGIGLSQVPLVVYNYLVFNANPLWRSFTAQNITLSPPPVYILWGFGLFWPLSLWGVWIVFRDPKPERWMALAWSVGALCLAYIPLALQRRFLFAYSLPLGLLAVLGVTEGLYPWLEHWAPEWLAKRKLGLATLVVGLACLSSLYLSFGNMLFLSQRPASLFDPIALVQGVDWLSRHAEVEDVVLSAMETGQLVAARAGLPVFLGHKIETVDYKRKSELVREFFSGGMPSGWLHQEKVHWVISGPYELVLGKGVENYPEIQLAYQQDGVAIYRVLP